MSKEDNKELDTLKKEHDANEISDKEFEEKKAKIAEKAKPAVGTTNSKGNDQVKLLKTIRNLLIAMIAVLVLGFGFIVGYVIYTEVAYSDDSWYYDDSYTDDMIIEDEEGEISEDGDVAY